MATPPTTPAQPSAKPSTKVRLELPDIKARLKAQTLLQVDAVVGISTGGAVPAGLVAYELDLPLYTWLSTTAPRTTDPNVKRRSCLQTSLQGSPNGFSWWTTSA